MVPSSVKGSNKIGYSLERSNMVAFDEMCRQLAFYNCGDSGNFDVIVLTFTLVSQSICDNIPFARVMIISTFPINTPFRLFYNCGDRGNFDVIVLTFTLVTQSVLQSVCLYVGDNIPFARVVIISSFPIITPLRFISLLCSHITLSTHIYGIPPSHPSR